MVLKFLREWHGHAELLFYYVVAVVIALLRSHLKNFQDMWRVYQVIGKILRKLESH